MNTKYDFIGAIIDMSGSMLSIKNAVIDGFNEFIDIQKNNPRHSDIILSTFNDNVNIGNIQNLNDFPHMNSETYIPDGMTAMRDGICLTINKIGEYLRNMKEKDRPANVIIYIQTDGKENASKEFTHKQMVDMIRHQTDKYNWKFLFAGANIDAFETGHTMGIRKQFTQQYDATPDGVRLAYSNVSNMVTSLRCDPNN